MEESIRMTEDRHNGESIFSWCGQPSDRGRLKNRTEHILIFLNFRAFSVIESTFFEVLANLKKTKLSHVELLAQVISRDD